jgi:hypothetical protein
LAIESKNGNVGTFIEAHRRPLSASADGHRARDLYQAYTDWCFRTLEAEAVTETAFGRALPRCHGVTRVKTRDSNRYHFTPPGIRQ